MSISLWILVTTLLTTACTDNINDSQELIADSKQLIAFIVDDSQDWYLTQQNETTTRTLENGAFVSRTYDMQTSNGQPMTMTSCVVNGIDGNGLAGKAVTRGLPQNTVPGNFKMAAYTYTGTSTPTWTSYFYDLLATNNGNAWTLNPTQYWPNSHDLLRFYAYAPTTGSATMSAQTVTTAPYLNFTVNPVVLDQEDLMVASTDATHYSTGLRVTMPFKHALTCVRFYLGDAIPTNGRILSISLENIVSKGRYDFDGVWTPTTDSVEFAMNNINFDFTSAMKGSQIVYDAGQGGAAAATMLMIPQAFNSVKQRVKVVYNDGTNNITAYATLNGTSWLPGTTISYYLSTTGTYKYVLDVTPVTASHNGGEHTFYVRSYRQADNSGPEQLRWQVTGYSLDGVNFTATKPAAADWFGLATTAGNGGTELAPGKVWIAEQTGVTPDDSPTDANAMKAYMAEHPSRGEIHTPFDLSKHDVAGNPSLQNTANCYVVNAPGWYKLPLVYGNGIKNGTENEEAWTPGNANNKFKDYLDNDIQSPDAPYIYKTYTPSSATLVWQDANGLIDQSTVQLCDNDTYLKFQIPSGTTFQQGNAIVAVRDGDQNIMWSWHIWVTDVDIFATVPVMTYQKQTYNHMPVNLGWCSLGSGLTHYPGRTVYVRIQQEGGKEAVLAIGQLDSDALISERGYCPFYQSMRKDPMGPGTGTSNENRQLYGPHQFNYNSGVTSQQSIGYAIRNPYTYIDARQNTWVNVVRYDLWNAGATGNATAYTTIKKTIYDPSPVGFHIPEPSAYTGFTTNGIGRVNNAATQNSQYEKYSYGYYYYTDLNKRRTIHFPTTGVHDSWSVSGVNLTNWNTQTEFWTGGAFNGSTVYLWSTSSYSLTYEQYNCGSRGECVRPIADY